MPGKRSCLCTEMVATLSHLETGPCPQVVSTVFQSRAIDTEPSAWPRP